MNNATLALTIQTMYWFKQWLDTAEMSCMTNRVELMNSVRFLCASQVLCHRSDGDWMTIRVVRVWFKIWSDWLQMGQIWDFLRLVSVHFGAPAPKCTETDLKKSHICPIWGNLTQFGSHIWHPWQWVLCKEKVGQNHQRGSWTTQR